MKKITILSIIVLLCVAVVFGQDTTPKTKAGDKAMSFTFTGLSSMGVPSLTSISTRSTTGSTVPPVTPDPLAIFGGKYYFQDGMALRLGIGFRTNGNLVQNNVSRLDESKSDRFFGILAGLQYDYTVTGPVAAYVGGGFEYANFKPHDITGTVSGEEFKSIDAESAFGVGLFTGVEWFPWSAVSLAPEVNLSLLSTSQGGDLPAVTNFGLNATGNFTLSIYF